MIDIYRNELTVLTSWLHQTQTTGNLLLKYWNSIASSLLRLSDNNLVVQVMTLGKQSTEHPEIKAVQILNDQQYNK